MNTNHKPRVLVVDDEPFTLRYAERILSSAGYEISTSDNPEEALDLISLGVSFDVVLCDRFMPGMTGLELRDSAAVWAPKLAERFVWMTGDSTGMREPALP